MAVKIDELIAALENARKPDRRLDRQIAALLGFKHSQAGWLTPEGLPGKLPAYTAEMHHAMSVIDFAAPGNTGGCSWDDGSGAATINGGPLVQAANPALALCIAGLRAILEKKEK